MMFGRIRLTGTLKAITALTDFAPVWSRNVTWIPVGSAFPPYDMVRIPPQHPIRSPPTIIGSTQQGFRRFESSRSLQDNRSDASPKQIRLRFQPAAARPGRDSRRNPP